MSDFLVNGLVVAAGILVVMATTCVVAFVFFRWGWEKGRDEAATERRHGEGDLAAVRTPKRLHSAEDAAEITATLPRIAQHIPVRESDLLAPEDSWPRQRIERYRDTHPPSWPAYEYTVTREPAGVEVSDEDFRWIAEDVVHERTQDAADRGDQ